MLVVGSLPLFNILETWAYFQDGGRLKNCFLFCLSTMGIQPSYHFQIFMRRGLSRVLCWKRSTVKKRGNGRENPSAAVQWHRAASQECRHITVHVPANAFYINLFLSQVCSEIKRQCILFKKLLFSIWGTHIPGANTGIWSRILLAGSLWAQSQRSHKLLYFRCWDKFLGEKKGQNLKILKILW